MESHSALLKTRSCTVSCVTNNGVTLGRQLSPYLVGAAGVEIDLDQRLLSDDLQGTTRKSRFLGSHRSLFDDFAPTPRLLQIVTQFEWFCEPPFDKG